MRRRYLYILLGLILVLLIGVGLLWKGVFVPGKKADTITDKKPLVREQIITSEDLIAKALKSGEVDYETSLLYRTYAVFGDPRLPEKYYSDAIHIDAGTSLFKEIDANKDRLSKETLEKLTPFMVRPNDPQSIFNISHTTSSATSLISIAYAARTWDSEAAVGGLVRVWTRSDYKLEGFTLLSSYAALVDEVWPKLRELIRAPIPDEAGNPTLTINPDPAIDIYIVPLGGTDPRRQECLRNPNKPYCKFVGAGGLAPSAPPYSAKTSSGYIIIDATIKGDFLAGTIAHELFHVSQHSFDFQESSWLAESTASWGEFRVLQKTKRSLDGVHAPLRSFFRSLSAISLDSEIDYVHKYGAYLYFFFAQMEINDAIVSKVWESATNEDGAKAVDAVFKFKDHFREFALRNWNFEPVKRRYGREDRDFPDIRPPIAQDITLSSEKKETLDKEVHHLTARYYTIKIPKGSDIHKVRVRLGDVTGKPDAGVDALVTIEGKDAEVRHWSGKSEETFCLDDPDERLRELVIIVSNASMENDLKGKIEIDPTKQCAEWTGTITISAKWMKRDAPWLKRRGRVIMDSIEETATYNASAWVEFERSKYDDYEDYATYQGKPALTTSQFIMNGNSIYEWADDGWYGPCIPPSPGCCRWTGGKITATWTGGGAEASVENPVAIHLEKEKKDKERLSYRLSPTSLIFINLKPKRKGVEVKEIFDSPKGCYEKSESKPMGEWHPFSIYLPWGEGKKDEWEKKTSGSFNPKSNMIQGNATFQDVSKTLTQETTITWSLKRHRRSSR